MGWNPFKKAKEELERGGRKLHDGFKDLDSGVSDFYGDHKSTILTAAAIAAIYYGGPALAAQFGGAGAAGTTAAGAGAGLSAGQIYAGTTALSTAYGRDQNRKERARAQADAERQINAQNAARAKAEQDALTQTRQRRRLLAGRQGQGATIKAGGSLLFPGPSPTQSSLLSANI